MAFGKLPLIGQSFLSKFWCTVTLPFYHKKLFVYIITYWQTNLIKWYTCIVSLKVVHTALRDDWAWSLRARGRARVDTVPPHLHTGQKGTYTIPADCYLQLTDNLDRAFQITPWLQYHHAAHSLIHAQFKITSYFNDMYLFQAYWNTYIHVYVGLLKSFAVQ